MFIYSCTGQRQEDKKVKMLPFHPHLPYPPPSYSTDLLPPPLAPIYRPLYMYLPFTSFAYLRFKDMELLPITSPIPTQSEPCISANLGENE